MRGLSITVALLLGSTAMAQAENFTFTAKNQNVATIGGPGPQGKPVAAIQGKSQVEIMWASGKKNTSTSECMSWSAPPASGFAVQGMCSGVDSGGAKTFLVFSCIALDDKNTRADCWGRLTGLSGSWQGKTATVSWRGTQNADGKGGTAAGAGTMN